MKGKGDVYKRQASDRRRRPSPSPIRTRWTLCSSVWAYRVSRYSMSVTPMWICRPHATHKRQPRLPHGAIRLSLIHICFSSNILRNCLFSYIFALHTNIFTFYYRIQNFSLPYRIIFRACRSRLRSVLCTCFFNISLSCGKCGMLPLQNFTFSVPYSKQKSIYLNIL